MSDSPVITFGIRGAQLLFSVIAFGLAVGLATGQKYGKVPFTIGFSSFVGAASLVGSFIGIASVWVEVLQGVILAGIDGVITLLNIAAGILIAYKLRGINCASSDYQNGLKMVNNDLLTGGCNGENPPDCGVQTDKDIQGRCKQNQADAAFMFLTAIVLIASIALTFLKKR